MEHLLIVPSVVAATVSLLVMWGSILLSRSETDPRWRNLTWVSGAALLFCLLDSQNTAAWPPAVVAWIGRVQFATVSAWIVFTTLFEAHGRPAGALSRVERAAVAGCVALGALGLVPNLVILDSPLRVQLPWFKATLDVAEFSTFGTVVAAYLLVTWSALCARNLLAWRRGVPGAGATVASQGLLVLCGLNDVLLSASVVVSVPVISVGMASQGLISIGAILYEGARTRRTLAALAADLEQQVANRSRELAQTHEAFVRQENLAALGRLCAGVAHEINNPAGVVLANLQYLEGPIAARAALPADASEAVGEARLAIERVARIVNQLQDCGRFASPTEVDFAPVPARAVVDEAIALAAATRAAGVQVANDVPADLCLRGQRRLIQQVLVNLLLNAQQAAATGGRAGRVRVSAEVGPERACLEVEDDGPGVPVELRPRLFEPFFSTRRIGEGMGLGLPVARSLAQTQRGELALLSTGPSGSAFGFTLERAPAAGRACVLVIDDDALVRRALARQLSPAFEVADAESVAEAVRLLEQGPERFAAVLCDLVFPGAGGGEFLAELRRRWPELEERTLFMTGGATSPDAEQLQEALGARVLRKPLDTALLLQAVTACAAAVRPAPL